jgi:CheY-like chemotaxis protein
MPAASLAILLVDDSADALEMYALFLSIAGYRVLTAPDAAGALDQVTRGRPDAVVMDLQFPGGPVLQRVLSTGAAVAEHGARYEAQGPPQT